LHTAAVGVVYWHAAWCVPCQRIDEDATLDALAAEHPGAAILRLDVDASVANRHLANEKVLSRPNCARLGAKPVLKSGGRFPCFTVHGPHSLQPSQQLEGEAALDQVRAVLEGAGLPQGAFVLPAPPPMDTLMLGEDDEEEEEGPQPAVVVTTGAAQFKEVLAAARDGGRLVLVVWSSSKDEESSGEEVIAAAETCASTAGGTVTVVACDVHASKANQVLAQALKASQLPAVHAYLDMKLCIGGKVAGADATPAAVQELVTRLAPAAPEEIAEETPEQAALKEFDPPAGKYARPGETKAMLDGSTGHFFPKMPCLRCGNPWWSSDEWNAVCLRCGWDCERDGYDDDSAPLPAFMGKWIKFVECIKAGKTPVWKGRRVGRRV
jgi:hypothetical protein